jgi:carboxyl-terminal processing protease
MRRRFAALALFALLFALGWWAGRGRASTDLYARLDIFIEVLQKVREGYVQPVDSQSLIRGAVTGMLRDLDPYAEYLDSRSLDHRDSRAGGRADAGVTLGAREGVWMVIAPVAMGPAERAGVRAGDVLLQVDGHSTGSWTLRQALESLRGAPGTTVRLSVLHPGDDAPRNLTVTRESPKPAPAPIAIGAAGDGIGYLRLAGIDGSTAGLVRKAMASLRERGAKRLALDLRQCATGSAADGAQVAELFLPRGTTLMRTRGRTRGADERLEAAAGSPNLDWPLAALGDAGTAGAAEVLMGALQDADRALIVGARTFGLGSVQTDVPLPGGERVVSLTTAVRETPSGRPIQNLTSASDEGEDDSAGPDSAEAGGARQEFRTASGRRIAGGGGIAPDVEAAAASGAAVALPVDTTATSRARLSADPAIRRAFEALQKARVPRDVYAALPPAGGSAH